LALRGWKHWSCGSYFLDRKVKLGISNLILGNSAFAPIANGMCVESRPHADRLWCRNTGQVADARLVSRTRAVGAKKMTKGIRRYHSAAFKAMVALEALKEGVTVASIATKYSLHPNLVMQWRKAAVEGMATVFERGAGHSERPEGRTAG
jgi:hypothetical protein